jgi:transcriptional regulator with XRE-family HTH domain
MSVESDIGARITARREAAGMTQAALGDLIGDTLGKAWPRQAVSAAEKGRRSFTAAEMIALAAALRCGISDLFGVTDSVSPVNLPRLRAQAALAEIQRVQSYLTGREHDLTQGGSAG